MPHKLQREVGWLVILQQGGRVGKRVGASRVWDKSGSSIQFNLHLDQ